MPHPVGGVVGTNCHRQTVQEGEPGRYANQSYDKDEDSYIYAIS